jgi:regulator of protease activity HflC (stomatin/prohibitin superfamily)
LLDNVPPRPSPVTVDGDGLPAHLIRAAGVALGLAVVAWGAWEALGYETLAPLAVYLILLAVVLYSTGRAAHRRNDRQSIDDVPMADKPASDAGPGPASDDGAPVERHRFGREAVAFAFSLGGAAGLGLSHLAWRSDLASGPTGRLTLVVGGLLGLVTFASMVASRWMAAIPPDQFPESAGLAEWLRGAQWVAGLTAVGLFLRGVGLVALDPGRVIAIALLLLSGLCAVELWVRGLDTFFRKRGPEVVPVVPARLVTLTTLFQGASPLHGLMDAAEQRLGLSLRSAWAVGFVRRSLGLLGATLVLLVWASTMLVVVAPHEQGIRLRFGRLVSRTPVGPGLHLKAPWPVEAMERYPVTRVQTLALGYAGAPKESLLWGRRHAGEEYQLLLGDGRELVSVDATVSYRIRDVLAFALGSQTPRETLDALAYRLLMQATVATDLDHLLTADRAAFAHRFAAALQQGADAEGLGLEILHVGFTSLHPPVGIAGAYEDVVSAEIERETRVARARVAQETTLPAAQTDSVRVVREAEADAARRLADAQGAAAGFRAALSAARRAPTLFRFRRRLEALEAGLADRRVYVVDRHLRTGGGELWIDVRPGTSPPALVDVRPPGPPPLPTP